MLDINLIGGGFQHAYSSSGWNESKYINWKKDNSADTSFYIEIPQGEIDGYFIS